MGCTSTVPIRAPEYPLAGPNCHGVLEFMEEDGGYHFQFKAAKTWTQNVVDDEDAVSIDLISLPSLAAKLLSLKLNFHCAAECSNGQIQEMKLFLAETSGRLSPIQIDRQGDVCELSIKASQMKKKDRLKLVCKASVQGKDSALSVTLSDFQVKLTSAIDHCPPVRLPIEESHSITSSFILATPRPWCWHPTGGEGVTWLGTSPLLTPCASITASFSIDIDYPGDRFNAQKYFLSACLELLLVRQGQVLHKEQILYVNNGSIALAKQKTLQHTIDKTSKKQNRRILELSCPGDEFFVTRRIVGEEQCRFIIRKFRLEVTGSIPGSPCIRAVRKIHTKTQVPQSTTPRPLASPLKRMQSKSFNSDLDTTAGSEDVQVAIENGEDMYDISIDGWDYDVSMYYDEAGVYIGEMSDETQFGMPTFQSEDPL